ncbi:hypothetical protein [Roseovarius nanhaiticus]|uniref:hypothetical protein n=1 Tax=Roseovarius nanhaiticus TaxID=573024 RepID=UPI00249045B7|nr:hypothetical protein [Roseovarius nanhaiticus]
MGTSSMIWIGAGILALACAGAFWALRAAPSSLNTEEMQAAYRAAPLAAPVGGLQVYHLGHSLVGRDMPAMLQQLAPEGHGHHSQLGWGTSLREHWEPDLAINGFDAENDHPAFRPAREAIASGAYDAIVLTEMVEIEDAINYHKSPFYLKKWAELARSGGADTRIYLYETWHHLDDPAGWLERLDRDFEGAWQARILRPAHDPDAAPVRIIPAGQVMAALVRRVEASGGIGPVQAKADLFRLNEDGSQDMIHLNDLGHYLVALTHYAVLYHRDPTGLPHTLRRADGSVAQSPGRDLALAMQETVWNIVRGMPSTGVAQ